MKKNSLFFIALLLLAACKEQGPPIDFTIPTFAISSTTSAISQSSQTKKVLIEDFTGVRCVNCPVGHDVAHQIEVNNPQNAISVSTHSGDFFNLPYPNEQDLNSAEGNNIDAYVGGINSWPSGCINRKLFTGESQIILRETKWSNYFNQEKVEIAKMNMEIESQNLGADSAFLAKIKIHYTQAETENNYISIMLLESGIVQSQLTPSGINTNYVHNNVLRKMLTPYNGAKLDASLEPKREFLVEAKIANISPAWNKENMYIVAYVHRSSTDKTILQVCKIKLK